MYLEGVDFPEWILAFNLILEGAEHSLILICWMQTKVVPESRGCCSVGRHHDTHFEIRKLLLKQKQVAFSSRDTWYQALILPMTPYCRAGLLSYTDTQLSRIGKSHFS